MDGPFAFNKDSIDANVNRISCGNYALGFVDDNSDNFHVVYVGRSESDLHDSLRKQLNESKLVVPKYEKRTICFKYSYASSPKEAFEKECSNYHNFVNSKKLSNNTHPEGSKYENWYCPICHNDTSPNPLTT